MLKVARTSLSIFSMGSPVTDILCETSAMKNLTATICPTIAVILGSTGVRRPLINGI
jgi:hypothetical protein